jgi:hypothetical protein
MREKPALWKVSVIRSEIRSRVELNWALPFFSAPFTPTRYRAQTHWYGYARVVDLDIGASKSDIARSKWLSFRSEPAELEPATADWCRNSYGKTLILPVVRRLIAKEEHRGRGFESLSPLRHGNDLLRQATILCDRFSDWKAVRLFEQLRMRYCARCVLGFILVTSESATSDERLGPLACS